MTGDDALLDAAAAVADGRTVDWAALERASLSDADQRRLEQLRFIAGAATMRRRFPRQWGPLTIIEQVGFGTFGAVYRAWDPRLEREVALKLVRRGDHHAHDGASVVVEEGRLLARVRHPNVVTVHGAERIGNQVGLWMEFIQGRDLETELQDRGRPFEVDEVVSIGITLGDALEAVHRAGLLHRDLKAQNVMRESSGRLVLTDFGSGRDVFAADESDSTGTPVYAAPEVLSGDPASVRSDIYSLGVLLYRLVSNQYPVEGRSLSDLVHAHRERQCVDLCDARPDLPDEFVAIVKRATSHRAADRFRRAGEMAAALRALAGTPIERLGHAARPRTLARAGFVAAAIFVASAGAIFGWREPISPAIAVLPLRNLSAAPGTSEFVDGLTDEIITNLAAIEGLEVRSRTSSFAFRDQPRNIGEVGARLNASLVLEGSVLRAGDSLRVNAQLVRVADDKAIWSGRFDREVQDVFVIQDDISRSIVNALRLELGRGQRRYNTNLTAYERYLYARSLVHRQTSGDARRAAVEFERVIEADPSFAPAHAGLATALEQIRVWNRTEGIDDRGSGADARMRRAAETALQLDPVLAEAHAALGTILGREGKWMPAEAAFRRAIELNPNLTASYTRFIHTTLLPSGKLAEAMTQAQIARKVDPLSLDVLRAIVNVQIHTGLFEDAIRTCHDILQQDPEFPTVKGLMARALVHAGRFDEALAMLEAGPPTAALVYAYAAAGRTEDTKRAADRVLRSVPTNVVLYAALRDAHNAFRALNALAEEDPWRAGLHLTYPELAFLRNDPRMMLVRRKLGLTD